MLLTEHFYVM